MKTGEQGEAILDFGLLPASKGLDAWFADDQGARVLVELGHGMRSARAFHESLLRLARAAAQNEGARALLVLFAPKLSRARVEQEWKDTLAVFAEPLRPRMGLFVLKKGEPPYALPVEVQTQWGGPELDRFLEGLGREAGVGTRGHRPDQFFVVLKVLLHRWLLHQEPVTAKALAQQAGCTYPTVYKAVERLGAYVKRTSDRRIELAQFPRDPWEELLLTSTRVRQTVLFKDRSGQPRTTDNLHKRLERLCLEGLAIGGVHGARFWHPTLDLQGVPRLDVSVHSKGQLPDLSFVRRLDPALVRVKDSTTAGALAVHVVHRADPLFSHQPGQQVPWADPVECLLDLHELRLQAQADGLIEHLRAGQGGGRG